ncbi:unnamed protein product [Cuscuta campestris]|uniref:Uncharacterized protein n=1 Tax=Cuscuta campestris TaxID=132261 RepID=A0A484KNI1_9ASTE|nr:unnamed protein product [Cuscuta campestris]
MFLSGGLDDVPKVEVVPLVSPKVEGPAWGGAKIGKGLSTSLREIQNEQNKVKETQQVKKGSHGQQQQLEVDGLISRGRKKQLSVFLSANPLPVNASSSSSSPRTSTTQSRATPDEERNNTLLPWAATTSAGSGSPLSRPSLRDIQSQQQGKRHYQHGLSKSPTTAGSSSLMSSGSPSDSNSGLNRWFKPEIQAPSPIRSIQIEERAIKELKRFYSSVKVVMKDQRS